MKRFYKSCKASNICLKELKYSKAKHYELHESERKSKKKTILFHRTPQVQKQHYPQIQHELQSNRSNTITVKFNTQRTDSLYRLEEDRPLLHGDTSQNRFQVILNGPHSALRRPSISNMNLNLNTLPR